MHQEQTDFQIITFYPEKSLHHIVWRNAAMLDDEVYKKELLWQLERFMERKPEKLLIDTQQFDYTITPEIQDWSNSRILPKLLATHIKKIALLIAQDLFVQVSIEQQMNDNPAANSLVRYFDSEAAALAWLEAE